VSPVEASRSPSFLVIVARDQPALLETLRQAFGGDPSVRILVDRRVVAGRHPGVERRRTCDIEHDLRFRWVIVRREQAPAGGDASRSDQPHRGGHDRMIETDRSEVRHQLERWIEESQGLLGRIIPSLLDDNERLRGKVAVAEQDCDRMRTEIGQLRREIADLTRDITELRAERQELRGEQAAIADAVSRVVYHVSQLAQPMNEILQRFQVADAVPVDGAGGH
jgi:hypothetical protein